MLAKSLGALLLALVAAARLCSAVSPTLPEGAAERKRKPHKRPKKGPVCGSPDDLCGARWKAGADAYRPMQVTPYTTCCPSVAEGLSACKATPIRGDRTWGTECAPVVEPCGSNWQACSSEQYAFTSFSQTRNQECCPNATHQCVEDPSSKHYGTKCVPIKACAEGRAPCGRRKGAVMETPDDACCAADEQCYIVDLPNGRYKSSCSKCDMACGRPALKDATGDDRCCLPRQVCRPAFSGAAGTKRTECVYPFKCRKHTCKHGGKCVNGASPYVGHTGTFQKCKCKPGFKGVFCKIKAK
eukprot:TRINITY_DN289_c1_g3_i1.p1 TRINITY_DN289_c1_g3~~TRINITY_DN289_c1_g3_i1.p1  ORF type:complete len:299 (-),score=41.09 TRINITY_DN289_c1_g3_i1:586-1482(-)